MSHAILDCPRVFAGTAGHDAPVIYLIDSVEHPLEATASETRHASTVVHVPVRAWSDSLTPWKAPALYRGEADFGGTAAHTLAELTETLIPALEQAEGLRPSARAICGYSLGGLFALYALVHGATFSACGCLSGSVWYEGWTEHLQSLDVDLSGRFAYLSLGTKERRASRPILKSVQERMEVCAQILERAGCDVCLRMVPGGHMHHVAERIAAGLNALDDFCTTG